MWKIVHIEEIKFVRMFSTIELKSLCLPVS